ncbi:LacI family DNA-binding transcriptional regulator [Limibacillus halophilus]|uniref:DNA-binding LacI/PurR family transcriptional regulator n=1 Tax=Limibacillus halophilus TaxID=1579333 RepID=A0A839SQV4_9PROT|nr:substrate-binding domain-containing protein [Limibacillus halophilus]MBB3064204.1 DNA-binding LacI/PurR family transcriptional regulator [Limibacillus halophilus]
MSAGKGRKGSSTKRPMTQKQLADKLGLSTATVSLALRDSPMIAEETRKLVRDAMQKSGYVYNVAAASLRTGKTRIVGVSFHDIVHPFFAEMLASIEDSLSESGKAIFINNHGDDPERLRRFVEGLREHGADGLIVSPALGTDPEMLQLLRRAGAAIVFISRYLPGFDADFAGNADVLGMGIATRHLLSLGHKEIVMLGGLPGTTTGDNRLAGFRRAVIAEGLTWRDELHLPGAAKRIVGVELARQALSRTPRPTAFACFNDLVAFGAMNGIRAAGLVPGKDIAVVGIDDSQEAQACFPPLTTVSNHPGRIGAVAANLLLERLADPAAPFQHIAIEPVLTVRESCGSPGEN